MTPETIHYLEDYITQLQNVVFEGQVHNDLANWHFDNQHRMFDAMNDINTELGLPPRGMLQPHIATTAVGKLTDATVIISANPAFSINNDAENIYRSATHGNNINFCRHFFSEYRNVIGSTSRYWTIAFRLNDLIDGHEIENNAQLLWDRFAVADTVGGIDLLPFHSASDFVTLYLHGQNRIEILHRVAKATLAMTLRLKPRKMLVTSRSGYALVSDLMTEINLYNECAVTEINGEIEDVQLLQRLPYSRTRFWRGEGATSTVISFPYQIFSGRLNRRQINYDPAEFARVIQLIEEHP